MRNGLWAFYSKPFSTIEFVLPAQFVVESCIEPLLGLE
jgi:hypothetical protein